VSHCLAQATLQGLFTAQNSRAQAIRWPQPPRELGSQAPATGPAFRTGSQLCGCLCFPFSRSLLHGCIPPPQFWILIERTGLGLGQEWGKGVCFV
uniref:Uncharacterized protein n=1 Tax=Gopherus agassizii TaxID=38772 RepID=A0A452H0Y9_9SAUR